MIRRIALVAMPAVLAACAAGFGTCPAERFYTLSATAAPVAAASNLVVAVGPVSVPAEVDRPQIVLSTGPNQLHIDEINRWATPLQDTLSRVVAENLAAMLGTPRVTLSPRTLDINPDYRVAIEVRSFESSLGRSAALDAVWTVRGASEGRSETGRSSAREQPLDASYDALAAAHSRAAARMSQEFADAVRALDRAAL
ncbi:MAG: PqiC family protein [Burkholderiales bacterium]